MKTVSYILLSLILIFGIYGTQGLAETASAAAPATDEDTSRISLELKGMDIIDVLKLLSQRSGLNIIAGKNVRGKVTLYLQDVDIWDAFEIILAANDLAYEKRGDIISVMTDRDYELRYGMKYNDKKEIKIIQLKFAKAPSVAKALNQIKTRIGRVIVDEGSNTVVILDTPFAIDQCMKVVQKMDLLVETKVFDLNYARAEDLKAKVEAVITKDLGEVQIDERTNKVIVTDLPKNMERLDEMIEAFDERSREVMIQAKIIEITLNDQYKMGIDWEGIFRGMNDLDFKGSFSLASQGTLSPGMEVSVGTLTENRDNWTGFVQFLRKVGDVNLLSSPRVTAMNNEEAKILVGSNEPYVTTTTTTPASGPTTVAEEVTFIDVGVKLYVTPTINQDGFVTMKIKPEVSSVSNTLTTSQNNTIPIVSTTQAETSVMLKDGVSIVIAGLIKDERSSTVHKMPGLGSIPLVGALFRKTVEEVKKKEIIIVLTPHIISGDKMMTEYPPTPTVEKSKFTVPIHPILQKRDFPELEKRLGEDPFAYPNWRVGESKKSRSLSYEDIVRMQTLRYLRLNYPDEALSGEVGVSFVLGRNGKLKGSPKITKKSNPAVEEIVLRSIEGAAPFPPFPDSVTDKNKQFTIDIAYE